MGRPPLTIGTYGKITTKQEGARWHTRTYFRDFDGNLREVARWGRTKGGAERALKDALAARSDAGAAGQLNGDTRVRLLARLWLESVDDDPHKAPNTRKLYHATVENHILPALGALRLQEANVQAEPSPV